MLTIRFYLSMLSVMLLDAAFTASFAVLSGHVEVLPRAVLANVAVLGVANLAGAVILFRPIARWLAGRGSLAECRRAVLTLPARATGWTAIVSVAYGMTAFSLGIFTPNPEMFAGDTVPLATRAFMFAWFLFAYAVYMTFIVYFAVSDVAARLRHEIFRREGVVLATDRGRLLHKLVIVFAVVAVMPAALVFLDLLFFMEVRRQQDLTIEGVVALDMVCALIAAGLSLIFVTRNLTKPIDRLMESVRRVRGGDLKATLPVTTNDELGVLTANFNEMVAGLEDRDFLRDTFGRYVSDDVAAAILRDRGRLAGETGLATVMFTDIEDFSEAATRMEPRAVMEMLNDYMTLIAGPIERNKGVINNFIGDAVLATFNLPATDPDHAANAVRCAMEIQRLLDSRRFAGGVRLNTRIGINTGIVVAGSVGPPSRLAFTVLGKEVNVAARLEALNKAHGTRILISAETVRLCGDGFPFLRVGVETVKGQPDPVTVFTVAEEVRAGFAAQ